MKRVGRFLFAGAAEVESHFAGGAKGGDGFARGHEFHGDIAAVAEFAELSKDIGKVDFTGSGIVAAGDVSDVDESDQIDVFFELGDEIAIGNLFVEKIVEKF